jgi:uncharacterized repeat protein (TIGR01451 family)
LVYADGLKSSSVAMVSERGTPRPNPGSSSVRGRFPLYFVENRGQVDARAAYYIHGADRILYFGTAGVTTVLSQPAAPRAAQSVVAAGAAAANESASGRAISRSTVMLEFVGANPVVPVGEALAQARFNYFNGPRANWAVGVKSYGRLVYRDLWPGIDLIYTASVDQLKYTFVVKPGADPEQIRLRYRGADSISLSGDGSLLVRTAAEDFHDQRPTAHQEFSGSVKEVSASYLLLGSESGGYLYGFDIGAYDAAEVLVIDPAILVYAGFIGGAADDRGNGIAVDDLGSAYITGETNSIQATFPVAGGLDSSQNGGLDAFVAKIDPSGTQLVYAGFIGGAADDRGRGIAVDGLGSAYITGETDSNQTTFPVTVGPDVIHNGLTDAFVAKINPAGTDLVYAGYIGGTGKDRGMGIAVDSLNRAHITGDTDSSSTSFPGGGGFGGLASFDASPNGGIDAFVARISATGAGLDYVGYIGGTGTDRGRSIAVDDLSRAYVTGETDSNQATFPNGTGFSGLASFDSTANGGIDAFVARIAANGLSLDYAGYLGGSGTDRGNGIAVDGTANAYVSGETSSSADSFPGGDGLGLLPGPGQTHMGGVDAFVAKVGAAGNALLYAGYIGGSGDDRGNAIALMPGCSSNCAAFIAGETNSTQTTFPVSDGPGLTHNGGVDAFVARINANGSRGLAGFVGGAGDDRGNAIALDTSGAIYLTGETSSTQPSFPVKGDLDGSQNLGVDAFVAKFCVNPCVDLILTKIDSPDPAVVGSQITYTLTVTNNGPDAATDVELTDVLPAAVGLVSAISTAGSCAGAATIVCDLGDMAAGASVTVTIVVSTSVAGKLTNTSTVSSLESDLDPRNNFEEEQTQVTLPNLTVKSISAVAAVIPGAVLLVNDTTVNKGKVTAPASTTRFFLSTDSKFDSADIDLGSRSVPQLTAKQSSSGSTTLTIAPTTKLGRYFLIAVADADLPGIPETKENNAKARALTVALPDLVVQSLRGPSSGAAGASVAVNETVRNHAAVGAPASTTQFYLSADALLDGGDALIGSRSVPALGAKGKNSGPATLSIPATAPGAYFIIAVADGPEVVLEALDTNNLRAKAFTVTP